ncbi:DUF134 domain-containing protein [Candidatus Woesearchaeota archaeon]|nr:DUF134 domain-containing protein [Candidatus Woesearchaeota archaeon]
MTRPPKEKVIAFKPKASHFIPRGVYLSELETIRLSLQEAESLRLVHVEGLQQTLAAQHMGVHQSTLQRILAKAEAKSARALINGCAIQIGNA